MRRLEKDESLCIGCHQCEEACSKAFYKVSDPMKSCIRITDKEDGSHHIAVCTQCGKCSEVCNTGVITEDARGVYRECVFITPPATLTSFPTCPAKSAW